MDFDTILQKFPALTMHGLDRKGYQANLRVPANGISARYRRGRARLEMAGSRAESLAAWLNTSLVKQSEINNGVAFTEIQEIASKKAGEFVPIGLLLVALKIAGFKLSGNRLADTESATTSSLGVGLTTESVDVVYQSLQL